MFWTIILLDLGVVVPAGLAAGGGHLRGGTALAWKTAYAVVGWFALVGPAVAAMGVAMRLDDDPGASAGTLALFVTMGVTAVALAAWIPSAAVRDRQTLPRATDARRKEHSLFAAILIHIYQDNAKARADLRDRSPRLATLDRDRGHPERYHQTVTWRTCS